MAIGQTPEQLEHKNLTKRGEMRNVWDQVPCGSLYACLGLDRNGDQDKSLGRLPGSVAHPVGRPGPVDTRESQMGQSSGMERRP